MTKTRLFYAQTTIDVFNASRLASSLLPATDLLAINSDITNVSLREFRGSTHALANTHRWAKIIDVPPLPILLPRRDRFRLITSWQRFQDWRNTVRILRDSLTPQLLAAQSRSLLAPKAGTLVDELFFACLLHPDIHVLYKLFPDAVHCYYPHSVDSLCASELVQYAPYCHPRNVATPPKKTAIKDCVKRMIWGDDAVPLRYLKVDIVYTCNEQMPWAEQNIHLSPIDFASLTLIFQAFPSEVQHYYRALAKVCGAKTGVLILSPDDWQTDDAVDGYASVVHCMAIQGAEAVLVKPHPRSSSAAVHAITSGLQARFHDVHFVTVSQHHTYPIEIILAPFSLVACGTLYSNAIRTITRIFRIPAYCPEIYLTKTYSGDCHKWDAIKAWIDEYSPFYSKAAEVVPDFGKSKAQ